MKGQTRVTSPDSMMDLVFGGPRRVAAQDHIKTRLHQLYLVDTYSWLFHQDYNVMITYIIMVQNTLQQRH